MKMLAQVIIRVDDELKRKFKVKVARETTDMNAVMVKFIERYVKGDA